MVVYLISSISSVTHRVAAGRMRKHPLFPESIAGVESASEIKMNKTCQADLWYMQEKLRRSSNKRLTMEKKRCSSVFPEDSGAHQI